MSWCGRRRDQADAGHRVADRADVAVDLVAGQLAALAGLRALRHLDLQLVGVDEVVDRHAEAARGDLLDRRAPPVAVGVGREARRVLAALARVRAAAEAVHRDRERLVGLARDRAEAHRAGAEAPDDLARRLDLLERHRRAGPRRPAPAPISSSPRSVARRAASSLTAARTRGTSRRPVSRAPPLAPRRRRAAPRSTLPLAARTACCTSAIVSGFHMWCSPSRRHA